MARFEMHSADMAIMGEKPVTADILFQMGLDSACGRHGMTDLITAHKCSTLPLSRATRTQHATARKFPVKCPLPKSPKLSGRLVNGCRCIEPDEGCRPNGT